MAVGLAFLLVGVAGAGTVAIDASGLASPTAGASTADVATPPDPVAGLDLPARMELSGSATGGTTYVGVDVGAAIDRGATGLDAAYDRYRLRERIDRAETDQEREALLSAAIQRSNASIQRLRARERTAREEFVTGDIDEREFVARLRSIHDRAAARESVRSTIRSEAADVDDALEDSAIRLESGYVARQGEVRAAISRTMAGDLSSSRVYVAADQTGVVLATVRGNTYYRETNRDDLFNRPGSAGLTTTELTSMLREMYPMLENWGYVQFMSEGTISEARSEFEHGDVQLHFDVASEDAFREYHQLDLDESTPTMAPTNTSSGSLVLRVSRTYPTGPARVVVTDDGQPVGNAPITVAGAEVARTNPDGIAWIVVPAGDTPVGTSMDGTSVTAAVRWPSTGRGDGSQSTG